MGVEHVGEQIAWAQAYRVLKTFNCIFAAFNAALKRRAER
jgi:hypothetical protein